MSDVETPVGTERWLGVGASPQPDPVAATRAAVDAATGGRPAAAVILFATPTLDLAVVGRTAREICGDETVVAGCTTAGEIADGVAGSGRLVAVALGGGLTVAAASGALEDGTRAAGAAAAEAVAAVADRPHRALLLLAEGLASGRAELVRGAYAVAGADVTLVGGCAGDELAMRETQQLIGTDVAVQSVVGIAIGSDAPIGVGIGHGWRRTGEAIVVTDSDGERIFRLDDQPALDYVLDRIGAPPEAYHPPAAWTDHGMNHPLGLWRPAGEEIRAILDVDYADRSLVCGDVPEGAVVWVMEGDRDSVLEGTAVACDEAIAGLEGRPPIGLIGFDCVARRALLGEDGVREEMRVVDERAPGVALGGFYTYGEIARTRGARGVHNATLVMLALS